MGAGIEIYNSNNKLQITDQFKNLSFLGKVSIGTTAGQRTVTIQTDPSELIAYRISSTNSEIRVACAWRDTNGTMAFFIALPGGSVPPASTLEFYRFGFSATTSGNYGFKVYSATGELVFNSNNTYMKILGNSVGSIVDLGTGERTDTTKFTEIPHDNLRKAAVLVGSRYTQWIWTDWDGIITVYHYEMVFNFTPSKVIAYHLTQNSTSPSFPVLFPTSGHSETWDFLVLDVTGL